VQASDAEGVSRREETTSWSVKKGECEISAQPRSRVESPPAICARDQLGVRGRSLPNPEIALEVIEIIEPRVANDTYTDVRVNKDGLATGPLAAGRGPEAKA
jgi:hypothetical protein